MLMLDHTTLFYFSLRDHLSKSRDNDVGLEQYMDWAMNIPKNAKPLDMDIDVSRMWQRSVEMEI